MKTYIEITNAWGPSQAEAGSRILIQVSLTIKGASVHAKLAAEYDSDTTWTSEAALNPNTDYSWGIYIIMPNKSITVYVKAYYLQLGEYILDDSFGPFYIYLPGEIPPPEEGMTGMITAIMPLIMIMMVMGMMVPMTKELGAGE